MAIEGWSIGWFIMHGASVLLSWFCSQQEWNWLVPLLLVNGCVGLAGTLCFSVLHWYNMRKQSHLWVPVLPWMVLQCMAHACWSLLLSESLSPLAMLYLSAASIPVAFMSQQYWKGRPSFPVQWISSLGVIIISVWGWWDHHPTARQWAFAAGWMVLMGLQSRWVEVVWIPDRPIEFLIPCACLLSAVGEGIAWLALSSHHSNTSGSSVYFVWIALPVVSILRHACQCKWTIRVTDVFETAIARMLAGVVILTIPYAFFASHPLLPLDRELVLHVFMLYAATFTWAVAASCSAQCYSLIFCFRQTERGQQVLLALQRRGQYKGFWNGCGGKIDSRESPAQTAARELEEESGIRLRSSIPKLCAIKLHYDGIHFVYAVNVTEEEANDAADSEECAIQWFPVDDWPFEDNVHLVPGTDIILDTLVSSRMQPIHSRGVSLSGQDYYMPKRRAAMNYKQKMHRRFWIVWIDSANVLSV